MIASNKSAGLLGVLDHWVQQRPDEEFVQCGGQSLSFREVSGRAAAVAHGLHGAGLAAGDRIAILAPNRIEVIDLYFGAAMAEIVQVPLNAYLKGPFLQHQLTDSRAKALVVDADGLQAVLPLLPDLSDLEVLVVLDGDVESASRVDETSIALLTYADLMGGPTAPGPPDVPRRGASEVDRVDSVMSIMYTSGTTGLPKGCVLTQGYYLRAARSVVEMLAIGAEDRLYSTLPLFHAGGRLLTLAAALVAGRPVAIDAAFSPRSILRRCREFDATVIIGMGAMGAAMLAVEESAADRDHDVRTMIMVPMSSPDQERFQRRFGIDPFVEAFGQTECMPVFANSVVGKRNRDSCGRPSPDVEVELLDANGHAVDDGEVGEICLRPLARSSLFEGYWNPEGGLSREAADGWFHTGDNGVRLPDGTYAFSDRKKDSLRRRGENVSSLELEMAILAHPQIAEVAVFAVPSELGEDDIKATVVVRAGSEVVPELLFRYFADNLPYFAVPRYVEVVEGLPRNAVGRVMKHLLRGQGVTGGEWDLEAMGLQIAREDRRRTATS